MPFVSTHLHLSVGIGAAGASSPPPVPVKGRAHWTAHLGVDADSAKKYAQTACTKQQWESEKKERKVIFIIITSCTF